jgi:fermentation-respiration switch protein FrsA (DUF1100 family)
LRAEAFRFAATAVGICGAVYVGLVTLLLLRENEMVYQAAYSRREVDTTLATGWRRLTLTTADGLALDAVLASPADTPRATVLYLHGNAASIWSRQVREKLAHYQRMGYRVLATDYRGYGVNGGAPSERGVEEDATAAVRFAIDSLRVPAESLIYHGMSLGSGVAAALAVRQPPRLLILDGAYTSLPDVAAEQYGWVPVRLLMRNRFPTLARLDSISSPVLIVHAVNDDVIPFGHSERLAAATKSPTWVLRTVGGHVNGAFADPERFGWALEGILTPPEAREWGWWGP